MQKTFILGVGSQKGGTTWLHRQLTSNATVDLGHKKEYHVFDSIELQEQTRKKKANLKHGWRDRCIDKVIKAHHQNQLGKNLSSKNQEHYRALELAFIDNVDNYFDYFDYLYLKNHDVQIVGDITPSYALLQPKTFRLIKRGLEKRGFTIKVIFLMRDPVERAWSMARMKKRNMPEASQHQFNEFNFLQKSSPKKPGNRKSRYEETIVNIEKVFDQQNIYYNFYERLFSAECRESIQEFLELELGEFDATQVVNASPKRNSIPEELNQKMVNQFHSTYEFILSRHGIEIIDLWQGYQYFSRQP